MPGAKVPLLEELPLLDRAPLSMASLSTQEFEGDPTSFSDMPQLEAFRSSSNSSDNSARELAAAAQAEGSDTHILPDLVIVFPRLEQEDELQSKDASQSSKTRSKKNACLTRNKEDVLSVSQVDALLDQVLVDRDRSSGSRYPRCSELQRIGDEEAAAPHQVQNTVTSVQDAVISDLVTFLAEEGCAATAFASCDGDELFLMLSLGDPTRRAQDDPVALNFASESTHRFQSTFDRDTADKKLEILQTMESHEEVYLTFNKDVVKGMISALDFPPLREAGPSLFKQYSAGVAGVEGSIMRTVDRARLLLGKVETFIDLPSALGHSLISNYYVPHKLSKLEEFRSGKVTGKETHEAWSNFLPSTFLRGLRWKVELGQPIQEIRDYFGERVAFYFLWLGYSAKSLTMCVPFSLVLGITYAFAHPLGAGPNANKDLTLDEMRLEAICYTLAAVLFSIGSTVYLKGWARTESYYATLWDAGGDQLTEASRPSYRGDLVANPVNERKQTKRYPAWKARSVRALANCITAFFISLVVCTVALVYRMERHLPAEYATTAVSVAFSIQILVYQLLWDAITVKLVQLANPRTDAEAKDLAVQYLFPFSFISTYANILFHAFWTSWGEDCMKDNCMVIMRPSLYQVVLPALLAQVVSMLKPYAMYRWSLYSEVRALRQKAGKDVDPKRSFVEAQAKRPDFSTAELNSEMNVMIILIGYVLLFGFVAPCITIAVMITFLAKIRIDAFKLCSVYQRIVPSRHSASGLGEWNTVLRRVVSIGRWTCLAVPIFNLEYFNVNAEASTIIRLMNNGSSSAVGLSPIQKMVLVFALKNALDGICELLEYCINDDSDATKLLRAKRERVATRARTKLAQKLKDDTAQKAAIKRASTTAEFKLSARQADQAAEQLSARVQKHAIQKLDDKHDQWERMDHEDFAPVFSRKTYFGESSTPLLSQPLDSQV
jgi:hypothetical protein